MSPHPALRPARLMKIMEKTDLNRRGVDRDVLCARPTREGIFLPNLNTVSTPVCQTVYLAAIIRNRSKVGAKPQSSPGSNDLVGKSDPEALDELEEVEGKLYQQDTGISIYVSSGRFDIQFCVKRLSEMMTKPRKLGNLRRRFPERAVQKVLMHVVPEIL